MGCMSGLGGAARFPLHLAYRIDAAGTYSIRLTCTRDSKVVMQSAWTDIEVQPSSQPKKEAWLAGMEQRIKSSPLSGLLDDIVPSLLASPDESALRTLLPVYSHWLQRGHYMNAEIFIAGYLRSSLAAFAPELLRRIVPAKILCPPDGACR